MIHDKCLSKQVYGKKLKMFMNFGMLGTKIDIKNTVIIGMQCKIM